MSDVTPVSYSTVPPVSHPRNELVTEALIKGEFYRTTVRVMFNGFHPNAGCNFFVTHRWEKAVCEPGTTKIIGWTDIGAEKVIVEPHYTGWRDDRGAKRRAAEIIQSAWELETGL